MTTALDAASYLAYKYQKNYGDVISEMKLHKLLYFAQRESIIVNNKPLFPEEFQGWRYGPVLPEIRHSYSEIAHCTSPSVDNLSRQILDIIIKKYGSKDAWSLSRLTHGEYSWQESRRGISEYENSNHTIKIKDIFVDAERVKDRRKMLKMLKG